MFENRKECIVALIVTLCLSVIAFLILSPFIRPALALLVSTMYSVGLILIILISTYVPNYESEYQTTIFNPPDLP